MSVRRRAVRYRGATGFVVPKPDPQLDSLGNPPHQPMSTAAAITTAAKPAASLAYVFRPRTRAKSVMRSEERRVGKSVDLGGRRIIKKKKKKNRTSTHG